MAVADVQEEVATTLEVYERATHYPATRTRKMIADYGEVEALCRLMRNPDLQRGFKVLRDNHQLDRTFEAVVVRNRDSFPPDVVELAQWRLGNAASLLD